MTRPREHASLITQSDAETGTATEGKMWSAERVLQSVVANSSSGIIVEDDGSPLTTDVIKLDFSGFIVTEPVTDEIKITTIDLDEKSYNRPGLLAIFTGISRYYPSRDISIESTRANVGVPSTSRDILINIKKNGTAVISNLTIAQTTHLSSVDTTVINLTTEDYLTVDITQIGSNLAGQDLLINFKYT